jgi:putative inorganic carbon (HCO3(-)) transporter
VRGILRVCRWGSWLTLAAIGVVLFNGGGRWRLAGLSIRLDNPINPLLLLAGLQGIQGWIRAAARGRNLRRRWTAGFRGAGWAALGLLIVTLPVDRSAGHRNATPWRMAALAIAVSAYAGSGFLRWRDEFDPDSAPEKAPQAGGSPGRRLAAENWDRIRLFARVDAPGLLFILCTGWALVAAVAGPYRDESVGAWSSGWLAALGMFWTVRLALNQEGMPRRIGNALVAALGLAVALATFQLLFGNGRFDLATGAASSLQERLATARVQGMSLHPNFLAALVAGLLMFVLAMGAFARVRPAALSLYALSALAVGVLVLTRSRGGLIAATMAGAGLAAASRHKWAVPLLLVGGMGFLALVGTHRERFLGLARIVTQGDAPPELVGWRPLLWSASVKLIGQRPWLGWGVGQESFEKTFWSQFPETDSQIEAFHAHNLYLEIAVEMGLVGLGLFLLLVTAAARQAWRQRRLVGKTGRPLALGAAAALLAFLLHGLVDVPLVRGIWLLFGISVGILAGRTDTLDDGVRVRSLKKDESTAVPNHTIHD